jgi:hypothetical protein
MPKRRRRTKHHRCKINRGVASTLEQNRRKNLKDELGPTPRWYHALTDAKGAGDGASSSPSVSHVGPTAPKRLIDEIERFTGDLVKRSASIAQRLRALEPTIQSLPGQVAQRDASDAESAVLDAATRHRPSGEERRKGPRGWFPSETAAASFRSASPVHHGLSMLHGVCE